MPQKTFRWVSPSPFRFIALPNLVSYLSLAAALAAIQFALDARWAAVGAAIGVSALADMLDGKFARLFSRKPDDSKFGAELDSLIDVVAFGMAPVLCLRLYAFPDTAEARTLWVVSAAWYILAVITRLGYFNVYSAMGSSFVGLPTTMVGILWSAFWIALPRSRGLQLPASWGLSPVADVPVYSVVMFAVLGVLMLLPVQFDRLRGWKFLLLPAITVTCIVANWVRG